MDKQWTLDANNWHIDVTFAEYLLSDKQGNEHC